MRNRVSPVFIAAGVVIGLSCFILLSMLFYDTTDYYSQASRVADEDGFRFSVASAFFRSLGIGAYLGWMVILGWGIVIFFREKVGDLALRAASLVVVIVSGAAVAALLGGDQHGGALGTAVGGILSAGLGSTLGAIVMIAIFGASFLYATDYGFFRYVKQAREAVAVMEVEGEEEVEEEEDRPTDWSKLIDQTVTEVATEGTAEPVEGIDGELEEELLAAAPDEEEPESEIESEDSGVIVTNFQAIETEDLDEDLLVSGESEEPVVVTPKQSLDIEEESEDAALATEEPIEETTSEVLLEEDLILSDEIAETAREMLAAFETSTAPIVEAPVVEEPVEEEPAAEETEEPVAEEDEEEIPVAAVEIVEGDVEAEVIEAEPIEEEDEVEESPEPVAEEPEAVEEKEPAGPPPGDVHSVFDALLGFSPAEEPTNGTAEPVETPVAVVEEEAVEEAEEPEEEEFEEPGFILTDDVIVMDEEVAVPEAEVAEEAPAAVEETEEPVEVETPVAEEPAETEEPVAEEPEREIIEEVEDEVIVEQVILVDEPLSQPANEVAAEVEEDAPLLPFMAESEAEEAPAPAVEPETKDEIPVLEDVSDGDRKPGVLRSIFGKKDKSAARPGDPLLDQSASLVIEKGRASVVFLQRRLDIGYTRASRLIDAMERNGLVGPLEESGSREVLMNLEEWDEMRG